MRVLIVSNLDSARPFGQYTRPFFLGRGLAELGCEVGQVGVDCADVNYGPRWSVGRQSLPALTRTTRLASRDFRPDVVYAHQNLPAAAALMVTARARVPVAADFHALPSVEWAALAASSSDRRVVASSKARQLQAAAAERIVARRSDAVVAAGAGLADAIQVRLQPRQRPVTVPNGVPPELLSSPAGEDPYLGGPSGLHAVATIPAGASPANDAALRFLSQVAVSLRDDPHAPSIHVLGTADRRDLVGLRLEGFVPRIAPWLAHADVCLLPYTSDVPLFGGARNKLLEYLALGRSLVTTDEGLRGFEEARAWDGVHIAPYDPGAFGRAIVAAAVSGASARLGRRESRSKLSWDRGAEQVYEVLSRLVDAD